MSSRRIWVTIQAVADRKFAKHAARGPAHADRQVSEIRRPAPAPAPAPQSRATKARITAFTMVRWTSRQSGAPSSVHRRKLDCTLVAIRHLRTMGTTDHCDP